jgi:hypothetical protein
MKLLLLLSLFLPFTLAYGQKHPFASDISVRGIQSRPMTTVERTLAGTFLGASDEAFLVYDSDDGDYYWWDGAAWQTLGGGGGVPGGADTELQYNAAGVFGGMDNFVRNATTGLLTYSPTLDEATGDENGLHVDLTANKATSGTWTGIAVDMADGSGVGSPEFPNLAFRAAYEGDDVFAVDQEGRVRAGFPGAGLLVNARDGFAAPPAPWIPSFFTYFGQTNWYDDNSDVIRFFSSAGDMYLRNNAVLYWSSTAVAPGPSQLSRLNKDGWVASRIAAAGDEIGFNNIITVNKLAGNYIGLQVAVTETAAPGTDNRLLNLVSGGNSMAHFDGFGSMFLRERVAAGTTKAGYGQLWTKNTTPAQLWFTDDAGGDFQLGVGGGAPGGLANQIQYNNAGVFGGLLNFYRATDDVLRQVRTTNPQAFELYKTTDSDTAPVNYERGVFKWTGGVLRYGTEVSGTGSEFNQVDLGTFASAGNTHFVRVNANAAAHQVVSIATGNAFRLLIGSGGVFPGVADMDWGRLGASAWRYYYQAANQVTDGAPNDDTTPKRWSIQRLGAPPTNAAYIPFTNSPGSPTNVFYLVLEEG